MRTRPAAAAGRINRLAIGVVLVLAVSACVSGAPSPLPAASLDDAARVWCARNPAAVKDAVAVLGLVPPLPEVAKQVTYEEFIGLIEGGDVTAVYLGGSTLLGVVRGEPGMPWIIIGSMLPGPHNVIMDATQAAERAGTDTSPGQFWLDEMPNTALSETDSARACLAAFDAR